MMKKLKRVWFHYNKPESKKNMDMKELIKIGLWIMCFVCFYNILTTLSAVVFAVSGFTGMFSAWILLRWDKWNG